MDPGHCWAAGLVVCTSGLSRGFREAVSQCVHDAGGRFTPNLHRAVTHVLVDGSAGGTVTQKLTEIRRDRAAWPQEVVDCQWLAACKEARQLLPCAPWSVMEQRPPTAPTPASPSTASSSRGVRPNPCTGRTAAKHPSPQRHQARHDPPAPPLPAPHPHLPAPHPPLPAVPAIPTPAHTAWVIHESQQPDHAGPSSKAARDAAAAAAPWHLPLDTWPEQEWGLTAAAATSHGCVPGSHSPSPDPDSPSVLPVPAVRPAPPVRLQQADTAAWDAVPSAAATAATGHIPPVRLLQPADTAAWDVQRQAACAPASWKLLSPPANADKRLAPAIRPAACVLQPPGNLHPDLLSVDVPDPSWPRAGALPALATRPKAPSPATRPRAGVLQPSRDLHPELLAAAAATPLPCSQSSDSHHSPASSPSLQGGVPPPSAPWGLQGSLPPLEGFRTQPDDDVAWGQGIRGLAAQATVAWGQAGYQHASGGRPGSPAAGGREGRQAAPPVPSWALAAPATGTGLCSSPAAHQGRHLEMRPGQGPAMAAYALPDLHQPDGYLHQPGGNLNQPDRATAAAAALQPLLSAPWQLEQVTIPTLEPTDTAPMRLTQPLCKATQPAAAPQASPIPIHMMQAPRALAEPSPVHMQQPSEPMADPSPVRLPLPLRPQPDPSPMHLHSRQTAGFLPVDALLQGLLHTRQLEQPQLTHSHQQGQPQEQQEQPQQQLLPHSQHQMRPQQEQPGLFPHLTPRMLPPPAQRSQMGVPPLLQDITNLPPAVDTSAGRAKAPLAPTSLLAPTHTPPLAPAATSHLAPAATSHLAPAATTHLASAATTLQALAAASPLVTPAEWPRGALFQGAPQEQAGVHGNSSAAQGCMGAAWAARWTYDLQQALETQPSSGADDPSQPTTLSSGGDRPWARGTITRDEQRGHADDVYRAVAPPEQDLGWAASQAGSLPWQTNGGRTPRVVATQGEQPIHNAFGTVTSQAQWTVPAACAVTAGDSSLQDGPLEAVPHSNCQRVGDASPARQCCSPLQPQLTATHSNAASPAPQRAPDARPDQQQPAPVASPLPALATTPLAAVPCVVSTPRRSPAQGPPAQPPIPGHCQEAGAQQVPAAQPQAHQLILTASALPTGEEQAVAATALAHHLQERNETVATLASALPLKDHVVFVDPNVVSSMSIEELERLHASLCRLGSRVVEGRHHLGSGATSVVCQADRAQEWLSRGLHLLSLEWVQWASRSGSRPGSSSQQPQLLCVSADILCHLQQRLRQQAAVPLLSDRNPNLTLPHAQPPMHSTGEGQHTGGGTCTRPDAATARVEAGQARLEVVAATSGGGGVGVGSGTMSCAKARRQQLHAIKQQESSQHPTRGAPAGGSLSAPIELLPGISWAVTRAPPGLATDDDGDEEEEDDEDEWVDGQIEEVVWKGQDLVLLLPRDEGGLLGHHALQLPTPPSGLTAGLLLQAVHQHYCQLVGLEEQAELMGQGAPIRKALQVTFLEGKPVPRSLLLGRRVAWDGMRRCARDHALPVYLLQLTM